MKNGRYVVPCLMLGAVAALVPFGCDSGASSSGFGGAGGGNVAANVGSTGQTGQVNATATGQGTTGATGTSATATSGTGTTTSSHSSSSGTTTSSSHSSSSGTTTSSSSSSSSTGGGPTVPPIQGGSSGRTTRYWDCCKPACAWQGGSLSCSMSNSPIGDKNAASACDNGGSAFTCWDLSPWSVSSQLSYGFAAVQGSNYACGRCYQLDFHGSGLDGKSMIVQVINQGGDVAGDQFDLLIPGGGVGIYNACSNQWGTSDLGQQYGGFLANCGNGDKASCVMQKCQSVFNGKPDLMAGCTWFTSWFNTADNPTVTYKQTSCPSAITAKSGLSG